MTTYNKRFVASILIEADTPLSISTGEKDLLTDSAIMKDANGLPLILGTSLTGVLRHSLNPDVIAIEDIFGFQNNKKDDGNDNGNDDGKGSRLIVSNAHFVGSDGRVIEGLQEINWKDKFYSKFKKNPIREHAKISHKGTAIKGGKFDEQVVFKGTRFRFELELIGNEDDNNNWNTILNQFSAADFRIGGGTRKGFGKLKIIDVHQKCFDLNTEMDKYLDKTSSLNNQKYLEKFSIESSKSENWVKYELNIKPENFWVFGSGLMDDEVDMTPVYEEVIENWDQDKPKFSKKKILIPATSVKGAISHRVAFHYNRLVGNFADNLLEGKTIETSVGESNEAVKALFGFAKDSKNKKDEKEKQDGARGNAIFSDVFIENKNSEKILNHVAIDRFTGGAIDGALFDEKVLTQKNEITFTILIDKKVFKNENVKIKIAFEQTLKDICEGMLPLGGGVMRGNGCFTGFVSKNGEKI